MFCQTLWLLTHSVAFSFSTHSHCGLHERPLSLSFSLSLSLSGCPQGTFVFSLVRWSPLTLGKGLAAPGWATGLGWLLTSSSVSLLPLWALYALATTPGTLAQVSAPTSTAPRSHSGSFEAVYSEDQL